MATGAAAKTGALSGYTVVDLTRILAGPWCCRVLADLGARVIKIEKPSKYAGEHGFSLTNNSGKEMIALDWMKVPADRAAFERILDGADVLVENYRAGVMRAVGFGWEAVHARWPRLVMCSVSGYGQSGPLAKRPAMDVIIQGASGLMALGGIGEQPATLDGLADMNAGLHAALGIQAALLSRDGARAGDGEGRYIDIAMNDCALTLAHENLAIFATPSKDPRSRVEPVRQGTTSRGLAPFDTFKTKDKLICLIGYQDAHWKRLCGLLGLGELAARPELATMRGRMVPANNAVMKRAITGALAARTRDEWLEIFHAADIACGPINTMAEVVACPQLAHRNMIVTQADARGKEFTVFGNPIKISGFADPKVRKPLVGYNSDTAQSPSKL